MAMDSQGGGRAVLEALNSDSEMEPGEVYLWPTIDEEKPSLYDDKPGLHIIDMVNFSSADWTGEANHGMKFDFETKTLLFPRFDSVMLEMSEIDDINERRTYDTLEDCVINIEQLKDELSLITMTQTTTGRDKWDTPEVKLPNMKTGRIRKDRYSSLLMANMTARNLNKNNMIQVNTGIGGFAQALSQKEEDRGPLYNAPDWFTSQMGDIY
jgi:hypothetical protein